MFSAWSPLTDDDKAAYRAALDRTTARIQSFFPAPDARPTLESQHLYINPDGSRGWLQGVRIIQPVSPDLAKSSPEFLLAQWSELFVSLHGAYGYISSREEISEKEVSVPEDGLPDVLWANFFGGETTRAMGARTLLSAPAWRARSLDATHIVIMRDCDVWSWKRAAARHRAEAIRRHVGEAFFVRKRWLRGPAPAKKRITYHFRSVSVAIERSLTDEYLGGQPEALLARADEHQHDLAGVLGKPAVALAFDAAEADALDLAAPWAELGEREAAPHVVRLAYFIGESMVRHAAGRWDVNAELREPIVHLAGERIARPLAEADGVVHDDVPLAEVLERCR